MPWLIGDFMLFNVQLETILLISKRIKQSTHIKRRYDHMPEWQQNESLASDNQP